jgi:DeoR/GlpR family transcriptional regulator of sugar metabolism
MDEMYSIEKKPEILEILEQNRRIEVNELSTLFKSSCETIQRDLCEMEENGHLKRTHGAQFLTTHSL